MSSPTVFVDFMDINKPHRKKIYQSTNDYNKIFSILKEFQMKLGSTSLEVKLHSRKNLESAKHVYVYLGVLV